MNYKFKLCAVLLSFVPLTFVKADTTACIFDWAESAAPSLISSSVETQNISYGDFTLRYYDKTQNALIVNEKTKELLGLIASMVLRCDDCIAYHLETAYKNGVSKEEMMETMSIATLIGGTIVIPHLRRAYEFWEALEQNDL